MNKLLISQHQRKLLLVALMTLFNGTAQANDPWSSDRKNGFLVIGMETDSN